MLTKIHPTHLHWATAFFKFTIWVYVEKYLNIAVWLRISPQFLRCNWNSIRPFSIGLQCFFFFKGSFSKKILQKFWKYFPRILRVPFVIVKHIRSNIEPAFRPLVSPSVSQSVSPSIGICNPFLNRPQVLGLLLYTVMSAKDGKGGGCSTPVQCSLLYCTPQYCTVLHCTVIYRTVLYWAVL